MILTGEFKGFCTYVKTITSDFITVTDELPGDIDREQVELYKGGTNVLGTIWDIDYDHGKDKDILDLG